MLAITLYDLRFRLRQFLIAVLGAALVFAIGMLNAGLANSFASDQGKATAEDYQAIAPPGSRLFVVAVD